MIITSNIPNSQVIIYQRLFFKAGFKAKLQKEGIFFLIPLFAGDILLMKKMEIEETKTTNLVFNF